MFFTVGIELPKNEGESFGLVVPALCNDNYSCFSAADEQAEIAPMAKEAIQLLIETMQEDGYPLELLKDQGALYYQELDDYNHCDHWLMLEVDLSAFQGKPMRINISIPDTLISRIDNKVKASGGQYKDRSHFLATAARRELSL